METVDGGFLHAMMWYLFGIMSYKISAKILGLSHMVNMYKTMLVIVLTMLKLTNDGYEYVNDLKQKINKKNDISVEERDLARDDDLKILELWRTMAVVSIINMTPASMRNLIKFKDWAGAMSFLKKHGEEGVFF